MKTIEEAAREYGRTIANGSGDLDLGNSCYDAFRDGIAFAEEWISIEDELPEIKEEPYQIFTKDLSGWCSVVIIKDISDIEHIKYYYTYWRPINRK